MQKTIIETRELPVAGYYDVVVAGGGVAGVAAALAARRLGSRVLLIEKSVILGGLATLGLISWYEPLCDGRGKHLIKGIAEELLLLSIRYGFDNLSDDWKTSHRSQPDAVRYATYFSPTIFALALGDLIEKEGIDLRLDMTASYPVMEQGRCRGIIVESKSGREFFAAGAIVDATGDADLLYRAGMPCVDGKNFLSYVAHGASLSDASQAAEKGDSLVLRKWWGCGSDLNGKGQPDNVPAMTGTTNEDVTAFIRIGQQMMFEKIKKDDPQSRDILTLPGMAQFRTTRHLQGEYELSAADLQVHHADSIGAIGDFRNRGHWYEIPYGCIYNQDFANLFAAGRIVSASGDGWEVTRVIPVAAFTGQAAGTAAHMTVRMASAAGSGPAAAKDLPLPELQAELTRQGIILHYD